MPTPTPKASSTSAPLLAIGLMSGTSIDGSISAALIRTDGERHIERLGGVSYDYESFSKCPERPIHHLTKAAELAFRAARGEPTKARIEYPDALKRYFEQTFKIDANSPEFISKRSDLEAAVLKRAPYFTHLTLDSVIRCSTVLHCEAVEMLIRELALDRRALDLIGYHGQTLYHSPKLDSCSVQVGEPQFMAHSCKIPVVYDFRSNDIANGGEGAPLAPVYHYALARQAGFDAACILNLGGTANLTLISGADKAGDGGSLSGLVSCKALDTGPANGLIDRWVKERLGLAFDADSALANRGVVDSVALRVLLERAIVFRDGANFLNLKGAKSLDIRDYSYDFPEFLRISVEDGCATLNAFSAECIAHSLEGVGAIPERWVVCGGGVNNSHLLAELAKRIYERFGVKVDLLSADRIGWSSALMEAELFAFLAVRSVRGLALSYPETTGVRVPVSGGRLVGV
jgi:anhydro-N-acetylmuramic acid kinase